MLRTAGAPVHGLDESGDEAGLQEAKWTRWLAAACLLVLAACFAVSSRWPLVGDSVLMHYVVWLSQHGFAPYRDTADMNLPLSYLSEQVAMSLFGAGNGGWRLYDGALVAMCVVLCWRMLRFRGAAAGVFAGALFATVHLQDGVHMAGQRDLLVALLQLTAGLALLRTFAGGWARVIAYSAATGALGVAAACIKPPALLFFLFAVVWRYWLSRERTAPLRGALPDMAQRSTDGRWVVLAALAGALVPLLVCLVYLARFYSVHAFWGELHGLVPYHASLERRPMGFLLGHIWSPVLLFLLLACATMVLVRRSRWTRVEILSLLGTAGGLVSYLVQGKGFPYQRYPFLLWVLLLCVSRVFAALHVGAAGIVPSRWTARRVLSIGTTVCGGVLMVLLVVRSSRYSDVDPYTALRNDLRTQDAVAVDGSIQCLDTAGTCIGALYKERLTQSTGFLYDCYLLDGSNPVVQQQRAKFEREWNANPPELLIETNSQCFTGPRTFDRYGSWPWMQAQLTDYRVLVERHPSTPLHLWNRPEQPYAYRILRRSN